ncbi:MAG: serine hydrolase [Verrucomicrobiae bacterium]|nr:serine hydrolase [Verrucomicrobiae bacterium]
MMAQNALEALISDSPGLKQVAGDPAYEVQILYTQIDRAAHPDETPTFHSHRWNVNADRYFYPASTVKLPAAILALEKLEGLSVPGLDRESRMHTLGLETDDVSSIARYIREIFLVSSNAANNRLFDFVGPVELSDGLQHRGYAGVRIFHPLSVAREPGAITTNAIEFSDPSGNIIHRHPRKTFENRWLLKKAEPKGVAYLKGGVRIEEPKDFADLNGFPLEAQQRILRALIFPDSVPEADRFRLSEDSRKFLLREMSRWTSESGDPAYDPEHFGDAYTKELFFGFEAKRATDPDIRMFSKSGLAYGTLTDNAYFADFDSGIEFFLSATLLVNANGTFNDDVYEYDTIGIPFLRELGRAVHAFELTRQRKVSANLDALKFDYDGM